MIPIGSFARLTGLSAKALRHYHDLGVLVPAHVDPATGYRTYDVDRHPAAMAGARRFAGLLRATFDEVVCTETVWLNLPPAGVFVCRRPRG